MAKLFADLHSHPSLYGFNRSRNTPHEQDAKIFNPWHPHREDASQMRKGKRANAYAQADVAKLVAGRCRLTFASITPIEKGFVTPAHGHRKSFAREAIKMASGATFARSGARWLTHGAQDALYEVGGILRNHGPLRQAVQKSYMRYSLARIRHMQSPAFDYWEEFLRELAYWQTCDGKRCSSTSGIAGEVHGTYHLVRDAAQLAGIIEQEEGEDVAILMTIEGAHTFAIGPDDLPLPDALVFERIQQLKALETPIFFITLAHHFDNGICGHAHSIPDAGYMVMDQTRRMHEGLEQRDEFGKKVVRALLGLDEDLEASDERRILIDCKHMSARSRKEYYEEIVRPANKKRAEGAPPVPVILSHAGYSGVESLEEMISHAPLEDDHWHIGPYYAWNLNFCAEDIRMVLETGGIFGVCLDQRVAGVLPRQRVHDSQWIHVLMQQLLGVVDAIMLDDRYEDDEKIKIWDCIGIGSDFDGLIDPMSRYSTVLSLDLLALDLEVALHAIRHTRMIEQVGVHEIVEKFCWQNAYAFAQRHFPAACR